LSHPGAGTGDYNTFNPDQIHAGDPQYMCSDTLAPAQMPRGKPNGLVEVFLPYCNINMSSGMFTPGRAPMTEFTVIKLNGRMYWVPLAEHGTKKHALQFTTAPLRDFSGRRVQWGGNHANVNTSKDTISFNAYLAAPIDTAMGKKLLEVGNKPPQVDSAFIAKLAREGAYA
jgi:hypothetical protein